VMNLAEVQESYRVLLETDTKQQLTDAGINLIPLEDSTGEWPVCILVIDVQPVFGETYVGTPTGMVAVGYGIRLHAPAILDWGDEQKREVLEVWNEETVLLAQEVEANVIVRQGIWRFVSMFIAEFLQVNGHERVRKP